MTERVTLSEYNDTDLYNYIIQTLLKGDMGSILTAIQALATSGIKVSANDTTGDELDAKLIVGSDLTLTKNDAGSDESYDIAPVAASESVVGVAERATNAEGITGTAQDKFMTAETGKAVIDVSASTGIFPGALMRPIFDRKDDDEIYLRSGGSYMLDGKGNCYWTSDLTYQFTTLAVDTWSYLYLDYSEIASAGAIDATDLIDSTTPPTFSHSKHGWYNGDDRCIFVVRGDAAGIINPFAHDGGPWVHQLNTVLHDEQSVNAAGTQLTITFCPTICNMVKIQYEEGDRDQYWYIRHGDDAGADTGLLSAYSDKNENQVNVYVNSSQQVYLDCGTTDTIDVREIAFKLPGHM
jgi:hypothetical protein